MSYDDQIENVRAEMSHDPVGRTLRDAFSALDDLMIMANRDETRDQVRGERVLIGQLLTRCQTLASFAAIPSPPLKVVQHG